MNTEQLYIIQFVGTEQDVKDAIQAACHALPSEELQRTMIDFLLTVVHFEEIPMSDESDEKLISWQFETDMPCQHGMLEYIAYVSNGLNVKCAVTKWDSKGDDFVNEMTKAHKDFQEH